MTQEVQVTLTLEVDATLSKGDIKKELKKLINLGALQSTTYQRMLIPRIKIEEVKEEAEIYNNILSYEN